MLEGGDLNSSITLQGNNELTQLAQSLDSMHSKEPQVHFPPSAIRPELWNCKAKYCFDKPPTEWVTALRQQ